MRENKKQYLDPRYIRMNVVKLTGISSVICLVMEIIIFFYFKSINYFEDVKKYLIFRLILPSVINLVLFLLSLIVNKNHKIISSIKNFTVTTCFILTMCCISINHAFYMVLWISPLLGLFICVPFRNSKLFRHLIGISITNIFASAAYIGAEYPENIPIYTQNAIVALIVDLVLLAATLMMKNYYTAFFTNSQAHLKRELEYEKRLHFDFLTGLHSKEHISRICQEALINCKEEKPVSITIFDIDDFKKINDTYGHNNGDIVLKALSKVLTDHSSNSVHCGRFGGEEFEVCTIKLSKEESAKVMEDIRIEVSQLKFDFMEKGITVSGGSFFTQKYVPYEDAFVTADKLLYHSKGNGKNQITFN